MSSFCSNCGFPLGASQAFCPKCGARLMSQPVQPAPPPVAAVPAVPAAKSSSGLKIVLVIFGVLAVLGIAAVAGVLYVGHRVKQAVVSKAESYGVDVKSIQQAAASATDTSSSAHNAPQRRGCQYLSKEEVSRLIGQPIEKAVEDGNSCQYFGPPGLAAKLGQQSASTGMGQLEKNSKGNAQIAQALNNVINGIGAQSGEERPLILTVVDTDGKSQMAAIDLTSGIFGQVPGAKKEEVPNLGDRAERFANLGLNVLKGNTVIRVVPLAIPDAEQKAEAVARAILPMV